MAAPKPILRRVRAESNEIDSILFSDLDSVAAADGSSTNSAAKPSKKRTAQEFISKKSVWEYKLAKCKNALARSVVQNAFTKHTPSGRKGTRFPSNEGNIVPEKEVMTAHLILAPPSKRARIVTTNRKKGWSSAGKPAKKRTAQELAAKQPVWQMKLAKLKNALARKVVEKAFANSTPQGWKKKRFDSNEGRIVPEKERNTGRMGQTIIGRGCKAKQTPEAIEKRFKTYTNDALRYAKLINKIDGFEKWGASRKLKVREAIEDEMERLKLKELGG